MNSFEDKPPYRWKTAQVFISSTFKDFHAERDYLVKYVFPELREWCLKWKLHLVDIDLRWGVTQNEAESGKVIDICLKQVDGCRPFFVCMLGNRYGWVPQPKEVPDETKQHYPRLIDKQDYSLTHLEIQHAVLEPLTSVDGQDEAPHAFFYFREEKSLPKAEVIIEFSDAEREAYESAFFEGEKEYATRLDGLKQNITTHYEKLGKKKNDPQEIKKRIFTYNPILDPSLLNPEDDSFKGRFKKESLYEFGDRVGEDLKGAVAFQFKERISALSERREEDTLETELDFHESFVETRTKLFIGRKELLKKLHDYVNGDSHKIFAVYGSPGCGKSALLAKFYQELKETAQPEDSNSLLIIPHFVGASPGSSALYNLLIRLCEVLKARYNIVDEIPTDIVKISGVLCDFLDKTTDKTVILIDGLNQLDDTNKAHDLVWLPRVLPDNVKFIASTIEGNTREVLTKLTDEGFEVTPLTDDERKSIIQKIPSTFCKTLEEKHIDILLNREETTNPLYLKVAIEELRVFGSFDKLGELIASLPDNVVDLFVFVLDRLERDHGKDIVERLFCLLECSRYGLTTPELKELLSDDKEQVHLAILRQIRDYLLNRGEVIGFFHQQLSKAIREKYLDEAAFSNLRVPQSLSWHGELAEYFMAKSLFLNGENREDPNVRKLIEQPWQLTKCEMWDEVTETLCDLWFLEAKVRAGMIYELQGDYRRALQGLPESQKEAKEEREQQESLQQHVVNVFRYAQGVDQQLEIIPSVRPWTEKEIRKATEKTINNPARLDRIKAFLKFVTSQAHVLAKVGSQPSFCFQHAYNCASTGPVAEAAEKVVRAKRREVFLVHHENHRRAYNPNPGLIRTLEGHSDVINSVGITADGKKAVSGGNDKTIRVWDLETGESQTLEGHSGDSNSVWISPNKRRIVSVSDDLTIRVWDLENRFFRLRREKRATAIEDVSITPDGFTAVSCGNGALQLWNLDNGTCLTTLLLQDEACFLESVLKFSVSLDMGVEPKGILENRDYFTTASVSADGKLAVSGTRYAGLSVWDLERGQLIRQFYGHTDTVTSVALSAHGKIMASASMDNSLRVWNVENGLSIPENRAHNYQVESVCLANDGGNAVSVSYDGYFNVWDIESGDAISSFQGHENEVNALCITPDDKKIVSGDSDGSVKVWKLDDRSSIGGNSDLFTFKGHVYPVTSLSVTSDGNRVLSACGENPSDLFDPQSILRLWDVKKGRYRTILEGHKNYVTAATITTDGRLAVSGSYNELLLWDLQIGKCFRAFESNTGWTSSICITPDSEKIVSSGGEAIHVWDIESGRCLRTLKGYASTITAIKVTPDGRQLVSGSKDGTLRIWNLKEGACIRTWQGDGSIIFLDITADSRFVVAAYSQDLQGGAAKTLRMWDLQETNPAAVYAADDPIGCISEIYVRGHIVCGTQNGDVIILKPKNMGKHVPYVTAARIWCYDENGSKGHWDNCVTAHCVWCGRRFKVSPSILDAINDINTQSYLCDSNTNLLDRAWDDQRLVSECILCNNNLTFNPFIIENRDKTALFAKNSGNSAANKTQKTDSLFLMPRYKRYEKLIDIPSDAGNICDAYEQKMGVGKTILYIQDIHSNFEAQLNISRMLNKLIADTGLKLIMVEGAWGSVSLSHLRADATRERRQAVAEEYLKTGMISGEEYLDIAYDHEIELEGIDDERLHGENTTTLFKIQDIRATALEELLNIKTSLYELQRTIYSHQILQLERLDLDYRAAKTSPKDFYIQLHDIAKKVGEDFIDFQHFCKFVEAIGMEQNIDFTLVERERESIINHLTKIMPMQKYKDLILRSFKFSREKASAPWFHSYLIDDAESTKPDRSRYRNLKRYLDYITLHESTDAYTLFAEADDLVMKIKEKLCHTESERVLNKISIAINIVDNCLKTRLIPSQFEYYKNNSIDFITQRWIDIINREAEQQNMQTPLPTSAKVLEDNLNVFMRFYEIAHERTMCFVEKARGLMDRKKQDLAVMIAGGYHAPLLKQLLIKSDLSFIVVSPKTTQNTDFDHYLEVFKSKAVGNHLSEIQRDLQDENTRTGKSAAFALDGSRFNEFDKYLSLGRESLISGRLVLAVEHYQKASDLGEMLNSRDCNTQTTRRFARAQLETGWILMLRGNLSRSLKYLLASENILWQTYTSNRTSESTADMLRIYLFLHYYYNKIGDEQKAREQAEKFVSINRWVEKKRIQLPFEIGTLATLIFGRIHLKEVG